MICDVPGSISVAEKGLHVAAAMHNTQDKCVFIFHVVHDDIFAHNRAAASDAKIFIAVTSDIGGWPGRKNGQ